MTEESADRTGRINRRGFLGTGAGALAAAALTGTVPTSRLPARPAPTSSTSPSLLPRAEDCLG